MQIFCSHFGSFFWVYAFSVYIFAHVWFSWSSLLPDEFLVCCLFFLDFYVFEVISLKEMERIVIGTAVVHFPYLLGNPFQTYKSIYILLIWCCFMFSFCFPAPSCISPKHAFSLCCSMCKHGTFGPKEALFMAFVVTILRTAKCQSYTGQS